jgi:predicted HTH domain antitoxin
LRRGAAPEKWPRVLHYVKNVLPLSSKIMFMKVDIPDEILRKPDYGESELIADIAIMLYQNKRISLGKAAGIAKVDRMKFQAMLADRGVALHYDLDIDLATLRASGIAI